MRNSAPAFPLDLARPLDLTGSWRVLHRVETSQRPNLVGLDIEFLIDFTQDGPQLAGEGAKVLVNSAPPPPEEISRVALTGWVHHGSVRLSLFERTPQRGEWTIVGDISWNAVAAGHMLGRFRVDHADTGGCSEALRRSR